MAVKPIPEGYGAVTPYLLVEDVDGLIGFLKEAFAAEETIRLDRPDGSIMHAEVWIGGSAVMMGEPTAEFGPMPASIFLYVEDSDAVFEKAIAAGGVSVMAPTTMEHAGERYGGVKDPGGNIWWISTHVEDVPLEEQTRRIEANRHKWE